MSKKFLSSFLMLFVCVNSVFAYSVGSRFAYNNLIYKVIGDLFNKGYVVAVDGIEDSFSGEIEILASFTAPDRIRASVKQISNSCFMDCKSITAITLPSTITEIPDFAFSGCTNLGAVTINGEVVSIGKEAFYNCLLLSKINLPNALTSIGDKAFAYCYDLSNINFPDNLTTIGANAFMGCVNIGEFTVNENMNNLQPTSLPIYINKLTICNNAYADMSFYTQRFNNCKMIIGANVTSVTGQLTNKGITSLTFDDTGATAPLTVSKRCFYHCDWIESVDFGERDIVLNDQSFMGCERLTKLDLTTPHSIVVNGNVFGGCKGLKTTRIYDPSIFTDLSFPNCTGTLYITHTNPKAANDFFPFENASFSKIVFTNAEEVGAGLISYMGQLETIEGTKVKKCGGISGSPYLVSISFDPSAFTYSNRALWVHEEQGKSLLYFNGHELKLPSDFYKLTFGCFDSRSILIDATNFSGDLSDPYLWREARFYNYLKNKDVSVYATPYGCERLKSSTLQSEFSRIITDYTGSTTCLKGDMNGDGKVSISDVNILVDELLK